MQALDSSRSSVLEPQRSKAPAGFDAKRKQELGQFLTPETIGSFMASLFEAHPAEIRLLDAGAGDGALTAAFVKRMCGSRLLPKRISVTAYELDESIVDAEQRSRRLYFPRTARSCGQRAVERRLKSAPWHHAHH